MKNIVIFSGTTEGKALSEMLSAVQIKHTVCVATDYGREVMKESPFAEINVGRMDAGAISGFLRELGPAAECMVIDATHPYAAEVTANLKEAAASLGIEYVRVKRDEGEMPADGALIYKDMEECARAVNETSGNILLTTGSKELKSYCAAVSEAAVSRTFVRVLPLTESLELCKESGIAPDHIIAMQGPFSADMNEALIRQFDIRHLITKVSGAAGGFEEKKTAAENTGICLHVIARPDSEEGVSIEEAFELASGLPVPSGDPSSEDLRITLAGIGMGSPENRTIEACSAIENCDAVFGSKRLIEDITAPRKYSMYLPEDIIPVLEKENIKDAVIVFSGDSGYCSGAKKMREALKKWRPNAEIKVLPGVSSHAYLASRLGESYDDACLFSIHGKNADEDIAALTDMVKYSEKVFVLLSGAGDVRRIAERLLEQGIEGRIYVGVNLSYDNESIEEMSFDEAAVFDREGIAAAMIRNTAPLSRPVTAVIRDSQLIRENVPMTKECIRHESIIRLGLKEEDVFYDIGGGTGSVAIEAASLSRTLKVFTIEKEADAAQLIRRNVEKFGLENVTVIEGQAQEQLAGMGRPDCVFIGGSGGNLRSIIDILRAKGSGIRLVINAVSLETVDEVRAVLKDLGPCDEEAVMISVSDVKKAGSHHLLHAQNPIWIFSFTV